MKETCVTFSDSCRLVKTEYGENAKTDISIDYTEYQADSWYPNNKTSLCIDKEKAIEIIKFLQDAFAI